MKGTNVNFKKNQPEPTELDNALTDLFDSMADLDGDSEKYAAMAIQLERLYKLKEVDAKVNAEKRVPVETIIIASANFAGILAIVLYEQKNVLTSKAMSLLTKLR